MKRSIRFTGGASVAGRKYGPGDEATGPEYDLKPLVDSGSATWADEEDAAPGATWEWSVSEARQHVAGEDDPSVLQSWHQGEQHNPKYPPEGRKGVRDAIEERLGELEVDHAAEGLARGPEA